MARGDARPRNPFAGSAELPRGAKGQRTRASLVAAARAVFERDGFFEARIVDITAEAGVATGTFYRYFDAKEDALAAVIGELSDEMLYPYPRTTRSDDPVGVIAAANRAYLSAYRDNAAILKILEQVALVNPHLYEVRRQRGQAFVTRNARAIRRLQRDGVADRSLNPEVTAVALSSMVSRMAWWAFVDGYEVDFETLVQTLTALWANALGVRRGPGSS